MKSLITAFLIGNAFYWQGLSLPMLIDWDRLKDVRFVRKLNKDVNMHFLYPTFGPKVNALSGKEVQIEGYMIPVDTEYNLYVLSAYPMAMCFFCGGSGPETIIELQFKDKRRRFKTDEIKTIRGKLILNASNIEHLNYILKDAVVEK
ncbi:hypothetical protein [Dyadobacter tibetensis]|uniref:hypothetical protein n=1 Tax=Dyadobacter tibetensis TaxID=1211851 RepID=UPI00046F94FC|nr:hypothetical protein [Dyadobacter tibetensis]